MTGTFIRSAFLVMDHLQFFEVWLWKLSRNSEVPVLKGTGPRGETVGSDRQGDAAERVSVMSPTLSFVAIFTGMRRLSSVNQKVVFPTGAATPLCVRLDVTMSVLKVPTAVATSCRFTTRISAFQRRLAS